LFYIPLETLQVEYLAGLQLMSCTAERQRALRSSWGFTCNCARCNGDRKGFGGGVGDRKGLVGGGGRGVGDVGGGGRGGGGLSTDAFFDVPPTRGWSLTAGEVLAAVERGSEGAGQALEWLAKRQRAHADGNPSYAEVCALVVKL